MGNEQGNLREQNFRADPSGQPPIPIRTAPGHQPYNVPAGADPLQAEMMQMVSAYFISLLSSALMSLAPSTKSVKPYFAVRGP